MALVKIFLKETEEKDYLYNGEVVKSVDRKIELDIPDNSHYTLEIDADNIFLIEDKDKVLVGYSEKNTVKTSTIHMSTIREFLKCKDSFSLDNKDVREITETDSGTELSFSNLLFRVADSHVYLGQVGGNPYSSSHWNTGTLYSSQLHLMSGCGNRTVFIMHNSLHNVADNGSLPPDVPVPSEPFWNTNRFKLWNSGGAWVNYHKWAVSWGTFYLQFNYDGNNLYTRIAISFGNGGHAGHTARVRFKAVLGGKN